MIRNCQVGQRVKIRQHGGTSFLHGVMTASFDPKLGDSGTVVNVSRRSYGGTMLFVEPDAPNFGELMLRPKDVDRLESK